MKIFRLIVVLVLLSAPAQAAEKIFNAAHFTLDNGLQVVVIPNRRAPVVTQMVWYKTGALDEAAGQSGLAHFVEHLMFKGTEKSPPGAFSKKIRAMGGNDNAFTSQDYTAYHETIAADKLETVMEMEADRMRGLTFPEADVLSERDVVLEERRQRTDNDPRGYFFEQMRAALFINHPYGTPVIGWKHEVDVLNRDNVKKFYDQWYAPNNAILVISGDVTPEKVKALAEKIYGPVLRRDVPERAWTTVPPLIGLPRLTMQHEVVRQPVVQRLYRVPSSTQDKQDSLALEVLQEIMDGGAATRLYRTLVAEQRIATSADFGYDGTALADGTVSIAMMPAGETSLEALETALDEILRALIRDGVTEQELREAKDRLKDAAVYARDSLQGPAMIFGQALATGLSIDDIEYWPDHIEAVTAAQVRDVAQRYLNPDDYGLRPYVTGWLLPKTAAAEAPAAEAAP